MPKPSISENKGYGYRGDGPSKGCTHAETIDFEGQVIAVFNGHGSMRRAGELAHYLSQAHFRALALVRIGWIAWDNPAEVIRAQEVAP